VRSDFNQIVYKSEDILNQMFSKYRIVRGVRIFVCLVLPLYLYCYCFVYRLYIYSHIQSDISSGICRPSYWTINLLIWDTNIHRAVIWKKQEVAFLKRPNKYFTSIKFVGDLRQVGGFLRVPIQKCISSTNKT
jgi:hypothetical protein